jgi:1,4-alpha-glucan branching enzyme
VAALSDPLFENLIIYQLHIGSFAAFNDDAGQVVDQTATFKIIASKLDYIRDLGFNAIQLLPVQEYRMNRSWGYDPSFFFAIESAYGTPEDLRNFVAEAHRHELAVLFDVVYNHATRDEPNNSIQGWPTYKARGEYLDPNFNSGFGW